MQVVRWMYALLASRKFAVFNFVFLLVNLAVLKIFDIKTLLFLTLSLCAFYKPLFLLYKGERI